MALMSKANENGEEMSEEESVKATKKSESGSPIKLVAGKKSCLSGKISSCKKKADNNTKIKEYL